MRAFVVDAFADRAFAGNPAGVVLLSGTSVADPQWMQDVAAELRHSETAFVRERPDGEFDLRWFTPTVEVDLCGHATLASAHVLAGTSRRGTFAFHTCSGVLTARLGVSGTIVLDFPAKPAEPDAAPPDLAAALGCEPLAVYRAGDDVLVEVADEATVAAVRPDFARLRLVEARGVVVTAAAAAGSGADFVSRFFGPRVGVDEDPVTGSAHCALGPFWAQRLGRTAVVGHQLSARGGRVGVEVRGDRVLLSGRAVTIFEGMLTA